MNSKQTEADYVPYGPEWEKEMSKFPKPKLIKMLGKAYQEKKELKQSLPSKPVGDVDKEKTVDEIKNLIQKVTGVSWVNAEKASYHLYEYFKSGYAAAPQKGMKELFNKLKREFEFVGDEKISGITALRLIKPIFDESPSPSEAGDAPFCHWCGYRKKLKGDGTIEPLCTC